MIVTDIIEVTKAKSKVFLDDEFAFVLYKGELRLYKLRKGEEVTQEVWDEIMHILLPKRAKKRSLMLLQKKDYTEHELRRKLQDGEYPQEVIEEAIEYVKSFRYIDDDKYCRAYINCYSTKWSRQQITTKLMAKGISKDRVKRIYEEASLEEDMEEQEMQLIYSILRKKKYDSQTADSKMKQKMYQHLAYKGFSSGRISKALGEYGEEY